MPSTRQFTNSKLEIGNSKQSQIVKNQKVPTGYSKEVLSPAYDALAAAKVWPVNDGMPAEIVEATINKLVEIGLLKENEKPKADQVVDREPANDALAKLGRWMDDPSWK